MLIINPVAGAGRAGKKWQDIAGLLKNLGIKFDYALTESPGHATELTKLATRNGYEMIVPVGGDGTINETVNGLYQAGKLNDMVLGIINVGAGGDYIRTIGSPRDYHDACHRLLKPKQVTVDLGIAEYAFRGQKIKRVFVNFAGLGLDAEVVRSTTRTYKALGSVPSYLAGLLTTFLFYRNKDVSLTLDGKTEERRIATIVMSHGRFGGGGMMVAPNANPADGLLDVMVINDLSKFDLIRSLPRIYKGTHLTHPKVTMKRAQEVIIAPRERMSIQADGELLGEAPARFYVLPAALHIAF